MRGGAYGAGTPREGWDHATPWMRRILEDVWGLDLRAVEEEFALVGVNPALDQFADLAEVDPGRRRRPRHRARPLARGRAAPRRLTGGGGQGEGATTLVSGRPGVARWQHREAS